MNTCSECHYVRETAGGFECRRFAPKLVVLNRKDPKSRRMVDIAVTAWPDVSATDWCGEGKVAS